MFTMILLAHTKLKSCRDDRQKEVFVCAQKNASVYRRLTTQSALTRRLNAALTRWEAIREEPEAKLPVRTQTIFKSYSVKTEKLKNGEVTLSVFLYPCLLNNV